MSDALAPLDQSAEAAVPAAGPVENLAGKVLTGIGWQLGTQLFVQFSRVAVGVLLARLVTPHEFGLAGMALVFASLTSLFTDPTLGAALIQRARIDERDRSTVFWTALAGGLACTTLAVAFSGLVGDYFGQPEAGYLFAAVSVTFTLSALSVTPAALLTRALDYKRLQLRTIGGATFGGVVAVVAAAFGAGAWAIIAQAIASSAASTLLLWRASPWRPHLIFSWDSFRQLGGFGVKLLGARVLVWAQGNADNLLVGRYLGAAELGAYSLAFGVMYTPMARIAGPVRDVTASAFARIQDEPERLTAAWLRSKRIAAALLAPAFLGLLVVAPDLVPVVFGDRWDAAVPVLEFLAVGGIANTLITLNWSPLQARGKAGTLVRLSFLHAWVTVAAFAIGLHWGIAGVAGFYALSRWVMVVPDTLITSRGMAVRARTALWAGASALPVAVAMAALALGLRLALTAAGVPAGLRLVLVVAFGVAVYPVLVRLATPSLFEDIRLLFRRWRVSRA